MPSKPSTNTLTPSPKESLTVMQQDYVIQSLLKTFGGKEVHPLTGELLRPTTPPPIEKPTHGVQEKP